MRVFTGGERSQGLVQVRATLTNLPGDTLEPVPMFSSFGPVRNWGSDWDSPHDTEPALTPGRESEYRPDGRAGTETPQLELGYPYDPTLLLSDGQSKGMADYLPIGSFSSFFHGLS